MRQLLTIFLFFVLTSVSAQQDTIVIADYTKVMVGTDSDGAIYPITSLEGTSQAGLFLNSLPNGEIRICNPEKLFIWIDGQLFDHVEGCKFYKPSELFDYVKSDTIYLSLSTEGTLADLTCDLLIYEELVVVKDEVPVSREIRDSFSEFTIICLVILAFTLGVILSRYNTRVSYILERAFTFKISAYEFVNTSFFSTASMYLVSFYALSLSFVGLYMDEMLSTEFFGELNSTLEYLWLWVRLSVLVFSLFIAKWTLISVIAKLFHFRGLRNFQLFDFLNFNLVLLAPIIIFLVVDFIINLPAQSWVSHGFLVLFPVMLILFIVWFTFKFVNNSPHKKLIIISYLCATEIIPVIIILGFFYK
ncbi:MAG: DUF4271 domain-containing protein [Ekhidna sp.]|uniref:DUF4271 domain-containing protein n=1 Tax=Ekhidna sp. TaxID=2608089 RepID=UPI0032EAF778